MKSKAIMDRRLRIGKNPIFGFMTNYTIAALLFVGGLFLKTEGEQATGSTLVDFMPDQVTTIPFRYVRNKILVPVMMNGKERTFLLDTGAPLMVDEALAVEMGYHQSGTKGLKDASGNKTRVDVVTVPELLLGNIRFSNVDAPVYDFRGSLLGCFQIDGIIGSNLLHKSVIQIDMNAQVVRLTDRSKHLGLDSEDAIPIRVESRQHNPYVPVRINDHILVWSLLDTGSDDYYTLSGNDLEVARKSGRWTSAPLSRASGSASMGLMGGNDQASETLFGISSLAFDRFQVAIHVAIETNHDDDSRIGMQLLERGVVTLDFRKKRFWFSVDKDQEPYQYAHFGIGFIPVDDKWVIREVWDGSDADHHGIEKGDTLLHYGSLDLLKASICDVLFGLPGERERDTIQVTVKHADERGIEIYSLRNQRFPAD